MIRNCPMSTIRFKRSHANIFICIYMGRLWKRVTKKRTHKKHPVLFRHPLYIVCLHHKNLGNLYLTTWTIFFCWWQIFLYFGRFSIIYSNYSSAYMLHKSCVFFVRDFLDGCLMLIGCSFVDRCSVWFELAVVFKE